MLSHSEIEERIRTKEIEITYSFLPDDDNKIVYYSQEQKVDLDDPNKQSTKFFKSKLWSDRLKITLGPIIKSHNTTICKDRKYLENQDRCIDIRDNNTIILFPYETLSIASNERIKFGPSTSALIVPRITNADSGIFLTVAYIDPYWDGILQMVITNATGHRQTLKLTETIAQCMFFNVLGEVDLTYSDKFPLKSHHFGQNWKKILEEDFDPFPRRKVPITKKPFFEKLSNNFLRYWQQYKAIIISLAAISALASLIFYFGKVIQRLDYFDTFTQKIAQNANRLNNYENIKFPEIDRKIIDIENHLPIIGCNNVVIPAGFQNKNFSLTINRTISGSATIWIQTKPDDISIFAKGTISSGKTKNEAIIEILTKLSEKRSVDTSIELHWMIIQ